MRSLRKASRLAPSARAVLADSATRSSGLATPTWVTTHSRHPLARSRAVRPASFSRAFMGPLLAFLFAPQNGAMKPIARRSPLDAMTAARSIASARIPVCRCGR